MRTVLAGVVPVGSRSVGPFGFGRLLGTLYTGGVAVRKAGSGVLTVCLGGEPGRWWRFSAPCDTHTDC